MIIKTNSNTFIPTGTSDLLIESVKNNLRLKGKVLDLGAGSGYVGLNLLRQFKDKFELYSSDISKNSVNLIKTNARINKKKVTAKSGSLFRPWKNYRFDFIINDVSGISKEVAKISPWFKNISCDSGNDGTKLTLKILRDSNKYLSKKGIICFPILSFANEKKILINLKEKFNHIKKIGEKDWVLPKEMTSKVFILEKLKKKGYISFKKKFGLIIWSTKIFIAHN